MMTPVHDQRGLLRALVGDGRPLLALTGLALIFSGAFAIFQSATGHFLPQDVHYLGMTKEELCDMNQCRIVHFMFHDRVSFGGVLIALGSLYMWLAEFPLRQGAPWAWWLFALTGVTGFGSFLAYLGYGYLDQWHLAATLALLPVYGVGLFRSYRLVAGPDASPASLVRPALLVRWTSGYGLGRACLLVTAVMVIVGGAVITYIGMTSVFVPQDLEYMGMSADQLAAINPRLVPLIAHDRAGFGGALFTTGVAVLVCTWCGRPSRSLWQVLLWAGGVGFATAIAVHPVIGYTSFTHLAPAGVVAALFGVGMTLCYRPMMRS
ncbi:MAG TPA: hypothetical protein VGN72_10845 [Tepidisphaeraceae bacterium]|jgi:hypothetical protein|nr:hypothetical protein [Tepidisphaeraceae bacterium]